MILASEYGKIDIAEAVLSELIGRVARESLAVSGMAPKNLSENLAERFGFDGRGRGVSLRLVGESASPALIVELSMQFWQGWGITASVAAMTIGIQDLLTTKLGFSLQEIRVEVVGLTSPPPLSAR